MQAKGADPELVLPPRHAERRLELVLGPDPELPVRAGEVELSEVARPPGLVHQVQWSTCGSGSTDRCVMALSPR